ncbi:microsomal glutathione S-transferase 1-like [Neocloeon triangulifer]|uniref:microsomal glutathione S-transferase 1-like n=1 Tax=Neocloeon triangulifer TaxID=2078957 RepID=UPI00286F9B5B|nr:microsomal glutathione S-transferase 1-like [Neocloeon triangulifer]
MGDDFEFSRDNSLLSLYACNAAILIFKMIWVTLLTSKTRISKKIYANPEDAKVSKGKVLMNDPDVERVRRAHLNDLENIPAFLFVSFLYILTGPSYFVAFVLFWSFTAARILHTVVYAVKPLPQPARALSFFVGIIITFYMSVQVLKYFW